MLIREPGDLPTLRCNQLPRAPWKRHLEQQLAPDLGIFTRAGWRAFNQSHAAASIIWRPVGSAEASATGIRRERDRKNSASLLQFCCFSVALAKLDYQVAHNQAYHQQRGPVSVMAACPHVAL